MSTIPSPFVPSGAPVGAAGGDLTGTYPGPTVAMAHLVGATNLTQVAESRMTGDANARFILNAGGGFSFGSGTTAADTNLYRGAPSLLQTDGSLLISGASTTSGLLTANGGTSSAGSAPVITPTFANGTAARLADITRDYMVYLTVGTAGTAFVLAIGPTSGVANTVIPSSTATTGEAISVRLPAGWFLKWSATTATLAGQLAVGC